MVKYSLIKARKNFRKFAREKVVEPTYLLEYVLDLWSRMSAATLYEFKIIIDVPSKGLLTWIISESVQSIRLDGVEDNQIYQSLDPSRTVFLFPLRKRLPFECAGHWKKVSNQRVLFGPWRKISSVPSHPIHDKDSQSAKNKVEQSERHLWELESVELNVKDDN